MAQTKREELLQRKQQEMQMKEYKKELKERVDLMELEYKELFYAVHIPKLRTQYFELKEEFQRQQEEYLKEKEAMEAQMNQSDIGQVPEPELEQLPVEKPKRGKKIELNPEE
jgi:hypothetical protein